MVSFDTDNPRLHPILEGKAVKPAPVKAKNTPETALAQAKEDIRHIAETAGVVALHQVLDVKPGIPTWSSKTRT
jgi:hypothetical protein